MPRRPSDVEAEADRPHEWSRAGLVLALCDWFEPPPTPVCCDGPGLCRTVCRIGALTEYGVRLAGTVLLAFAAALL